ncbi:quorum-sensing phosphorelay protein LuxU [Vibrio sp. 10N.261.55.A7]|uniref:quorum-sensing phosphorelay protein LuxU n=1 Tax=Vibrio sp. 10N.261.55.A7 TaxID=1880851 RepID=UPI000C82C2DC|nr:quorum-sensing phosphorelay protein LuxU [Vibrio sp. 10N.261.55.A7]PMK05204.1 phosphorelay protein LuxU [Vibrio sp. 10N.261.55.A7]
MEILNQQKIDRLSNEIGAENVPILLDIFLGELNQYISTIVNDETRNNADYLREISHALKSSAASFGADQLCHLSIQMDNRIKAGEALNPIEDSAIMVKTLEITRDVYRELVTR